jgi:hypothetical protein
MPKPKTSENHENREAQKQKTKGKNIKRPKII